MYNPATISRKSFKGIIICTCYLFFLLNLAWEPTTSAWGAAFGGPLTSSNLTEGAVFDTLSSNRHVDYQA